MAKSRYFRKIYKSWDNQYDFLLTGKRGRKISLKESQRRRRINDTADNMAFSKRILEKKEWVKKQKITDLRKYKLENQVDDLVSIFRGKPKGRRIVDAYYKNPPVSRRLVSDIRHKNYDLVLQRKNNFPKSDWVTASDTRASARIYNESLKSRNSLLEKVYKRHVKRGLTDLRFDKWLRKNRSLINKFEV